MTHDSPRILKTRRLIIRRAEPSPRDIAFLLELWTNPTVMSNVGFPAGLQTSAEEIEQQLLSQGATEFDCVLLATLQNTGDIIGECRLDSPDADGTAHTDIKLTPRYWHQGYGKEIKLALLEHLFARPDCLQVRATPNQTNVASIRLQESVGGRKTDEGIYRFPESMKEYTSDIPFFEYTVFRDDWERFRAGERQR